MVELLIFLAQVCSSNSCVVYEKEAPPIIAVCNVDKTFGGGVVRSRSGEVILVISPVQCNHS